jgi:pyrimidine precursor biosynthesis enzyme
MKPTDYEAVRCGMNVSKAIIEGSIHAGIGLENVQMVELEEWLARQGRPRSDVQMLRIDELAELGCCCFCSILYIGMSSFACFLCSMLLTPKFSNSKRHIHGREP